MGSGLILGIESSCDETASAIVACGTHTRSSIVASQVGLHATYGGVVPELASREHLRNIVFIVEQALDEAGCRLGDLEAIAVTNGPGLAGALLVGISYAKALAFALNKPLIAVNHLEGHIHAVLLEQSEGREQRLAMPSLALVVSGGHTHLFLAEPPSAGAVVGAWRYTLVGRTLDDAAGEAFDKVAKLLGLGYPGGPWIDNLARLGSAHAVPFRFAQIKAKPHLEGKTARTKGALTAPIEDLDRNYLFSFSGIKTAVLRHVETHCMHAAADERARRLMEISDDKGKATWQDAAPLCDQATLDLIASFQHAVVENLVRRTMDAAEATGARSVLVTGGVAANSALRARFIEESGRRGLPVAFPSLAMSTDNAAMIAAAAWPRFLAGDFAALDLEASPRLVLR